MGWCHGTGAPPHPPPAPQVGLSATQPASVPLFDEVGGWPAILHQLTSGQDLSADHAAAAMAEVFAGRATPAQTAAFIVALRMKGETIEEITGLSQAMAAAAERVVVPDDLQDRLVDTCGTGGDRSGSINVSTMAALVVAGCGVPVVKHGNRAASSACGTADVLEALGVRIDLGADGVLHCLLDAGMGFCFAQRFHPAMRHAGPVRRELGVPTVFNFLGPLTNPSGARRQMLGISDGSMASRMAGVLAARGSLSAIVVHGHGGLDEASTTGPSEALRVFADGHIEPMTIDPAALGLASATAADLAGGDAATNAEVVRVVLGGATGPHRDIVLLNAAAALVVADVADSVETGLGLAAASVDDGAAASVLDRLITASNA